MNRDDRYWYDDDNVLTDLVSLNVIDVMKYHSGYIGKVFNSEVVEVLNRLDWSDETVLPLLSMIKHKQFSNFFDNPHITMDEITYQDIIDMIKESPIYIKDLDNLIKRVRYDMDDIRDNVRWFATNIKELNKTYNKYKMLREIVDGDRFSITLLQSVFYTK